MVAMAGLAALLSACSFSHTSFHTEGLIAPPRACIIEPAAIGFAERLPAIDEGNGCEVPNPWLVHSLATVQFSRPATLNCSMADPLHTWLQNTVEPEARRRFGTSVVAIDVIASYSCRPRNNVWGAKMSEHGFGDAIDIAGFTLADGRNVTVEQGWRGNAAERSFLRGIRSAACDDFMTVLGPGSDAEHYNHFHLDLQARRSGEHYCH
jgi:hypothetical protein